MIYALVLIAIVALWPRGLGVTGRARGILAAIGLLVIGVLVLAAR
jgi:hypothetical protein